MTVFFFPWKHRFYMTSPPAMGCQRWPSHLSQIEVPSAGGLSPVPRRTVRSGERRNWHGGQTPRPAPSQQEFEKVCHKILSHLREFYDLKSSYMFFLNHLTWHSHSTEPKVMLGIASVHPFRSPSRDWLWTLTGYLVGGLEQFLFFSISWGFHSSSQLTDS